MINEVVYTLNNMGRYSNITIFFECGIVVYTLKNESRCSRILTNWLLLWIVCNLRNVVDAANAGKTVLP